MDGSVPDSWEARILAAVLAVGGEAVAARATAARVLGLDVACGPHDAAIHLLDRQRTFRALPGIVVHRSRTLDDWHDDLRRANGVVLAGWRDVLRFNSRDLDHHPDEVVATIRRGLRRAGRR